MFHTGNHTVAHIINKQGAELPFPLQSDGQILRNFVFICLSKSRTHVPIGSERLHTDSCAVRLKILETRETGNFKGIKVGSTEFM